jgi:uncharacterized protein (UPF0305 family)
MGRIAIHRNDNPRDIAKNFAKTYSLNQKLLVQLEEMLTKYLTSFLKKSPAEVLSYIKYDSSDSD